VVSLWIGLSYGSIDQCEEAKNLSSPTAVQNKLEAQCAALILCLYFEIFPFFQMRLFIPAISVRSNRSIPLFEKDGLGEI